MCLIDDLKAYRVKKSLCYSIPIYCVFGDTTLNSIVRERPKDILGFSKVRGFDKEKCERYGQDIIDIVGNSIDTIPKPLAKIVRREEEVYILELAMNRVYVGRSGDVVKRIKSHKRGTGSIFTKVYPPTGKLLPRLGDVRGSGDCAGKFFCGVDCAFLQFLILSPCSERDETLRYMYKLGTSLVRGWKYTQLDMSEADEIDAEMNIRELFDLCRKCGRRGHFIGQCRHQTDRNGLPC